MSEVLFELNTRTLLEFNLLQLKLQTFMIKIIAKSFLARIIFIREILITLCILKCYSEIKTTRELIPNSASSLKTFTIPNQLL